MKKERGGYQAQKTSLEEKRDADVKELLDKITKLQEDHTQLETDLSNKGKMLNEMKEARQHLAGADDEHAKETDERTRREWEGLRGSLHHQLVEETKISHRLDQQYHALVEQFTLHQHQAGMAFYGAPDPTTSGVNAAATAAGIDPMSMDHVAMQSRRPSFGSADAVHMSPLDSQMATTDSPSQMPPPGLTRVGPASFAPLLFMPDNHEALSEDDLKSAGGLLSPSAQAYLPSGIIDNESDNNRAATKPPMLPDSVTAGEDDPQSPASSGRSYSVLSSPHSSSFKLSFPQYQDPTSNKNEQSTNHRLTSLLSGFQRSRKPDDGDGDGLPMGTLKSGQSQSFPRGTDEADITGASRRRISLSLKAHRNSTGLDGSPVQGFGTGTNASPSSRMMSRRLNPFASAAPGGNSMSSVFDRNADGSRPASIASMDMARPSTDSGSIWNAAGEGSGPSRLWPSGEGGWWGSRAGSRRPSNHGSPSMLTTTLASADDEILYETELNDAKTRPSHVGVIGSRPRAAKDTSGGGGESSSSLSQRLNPNAPTFMGLFRSSKNADKDKDKERERERAWERASNASVAGGDEDTTTHSFLQQQQAPRASVDAASTSMSMTESHDSLPLETSHSTDNVNGLRKLLRKGSASSKFSLFKKGPGSATTAASDRVASAEHRSRSSLGDVPDEVEGVLPYYEEATSASVAAAAQQQMQGKGYDGGSGGGSGSVTSSPALGRARSRESSHREGDRLWRFMKKRDKESLEMERE